MKFIFLISLFFVIGCDTKSSDKSYKPMSKEQRVCVKNATKEYFDLTIKAHSYEWMTAFEKNEGYIPLLLKHRRQEEKLCMVVANCYDNEPIKSIEFDECLKGWGDASQE